MGQRVPADYLKRNDFVLIEELQEACQQVGSLYSQDLDMFYLYVTHKVQPHTSFEAITVVDLFKLIIDFCIYSDVENAED